MPISCRTASAFYENWLNAEGLRDGTIGLAPFYAVLSFLRQEGDAYHIITSRAGEYAAEWTVESMPPLERATIRASPAWLRGRLLVRLARRLVRKQLSRAVARSRRSGAARHGSTCARVFSAPCGSPSGHPLCGFYAAAFTRLLTLFNMQARAEVLACRGTGEPACVMSMALGNGSPEAGGRA